MRGRRARHPQRAAPPTPLTLHADDDAHQLPAGVRVPEPLVVGGQLVEGVTGGGIQHDHEVAQAGGVQHLPHWQVAYSSLQGRWVWQGSGLGIAARHG